jgi:DNA repair protein RadC
MEMNTEEPLSLAMSSTLDDGQLHAGHRQRVRDRYLSEGLDAFKDHEVLELLLFYCMPKRDTNPVAHAMLREYGSLSGLFEADPRDIERRCGLSIATAILLTMAGPLTRRYLKQRWGDRPILGTSARAGEFAVSLFAGRPYEVFYVICLDAQNRVNHAALVHEGTLNEAPVYPRLIVEAALRHKANSIILSHNHPGGSLLASGPDLDVTRRIRSALTPISIPVVDHIIVAGERYASLAEQGLLER